ncbi:gamma-glutamyltranspeptidase [Rhizobium sp. BK313]|uniref:hypothetical protein n=1 Tax=Rhizobium sp. BK313 TaxID=2587081 RepID=UPI0017D76BF4|nr:hypothetical protein [Rhizobium sp. BK313]MBB3457246.1 gamma-glutamyltranspeptidase [Rhizobium sp. BK313]
MRSRRSSPRARRWPSPTPHFCGLGGDAVWLVAVETGKAQTFLGIGRAPVVIATEIFRSAVQLHPYDRLPRG